MRHKNHFTISGFIMSKLKVSKKENSFKDLLKKYIEIKGLDIILLMDDGIEIELHKNRKLINDEIIIMDKSFGEKRIKLSKIRSVDLYAA